MRHDAAANRFVVVGTTGAGKTTLARRIAEALDLPHVELDAYRYGPNWTEKPDDAVKDVLRGTTQLCR